MSYLVLARKYRPQTFEDVVGQAHVTHTLANAVRSGRIAHAILFSGPRGTGKTTIARILAKAMNCETGPTPIPCNTCTSCTEITAGSAVDVFEIDGASNNGVDHIRDLRDNVRYMPAHHRFKIYIIDEVHMLSTAAFNALLKTLEEPPAHVLFLFATTEPHKIPITILSRCQQHHLRRIETKDVARHLTDLCRREEKTVPAESLSLIAREAEGSIRDALSLLDQVMSCAEGQITHEDVIDLLGATDREVMFKITESVLTRNVADILDVIDDTYRRGHDIKAFFGALTLHFRDLWIARTMKNAASLIDAAPGEIDRMKALTANVSEVYLSQILDAFTREEPAMKFAASPRLALEMAFIRLFQIQPALPIETLIEKLDDLARRSAAPPSTFPSSAETRLSPPQMREPGPPRADQTFDHTPDRRIDTGTSPYENRNENKKTERSPARLAVESPEGSLTPPSPELSFGIAPENGPEMPEETKPSSDDTAIPAPAPHVVSPSAMETPAAGSHDNPAECRLFDPAADGYDPDDSLEAVWRKLTAQICGRSSALGSYLTRSALVRMEDGALEIAVQGGAFNLKQIQKKQGVIEEAARGFFGRDCRLSFSIDNTEDDSRQVRIEQANTIRQEALNHPMVTAAMEIFDGTLVDIKIL